MNSILGIKFRMAVFGLKSVCDAKEEAIFEAVIKSSEFEELIKTLEKICEEACKDKQLKKEFQLAIKDTREFHAAEKVEDLFKDPKFEQAVMALEKIYAVIYGKARDYDSEYEHFLKEIKRIADSQPKERKSSSVRMWKKGVVGLAIAAFATGAYYMKKRRSEKKKGEKESSNPG